MLPAIMILKPGSNMSRFVYRRTAIEDTTVASIKAFVDDF